MGATADRRDGGEASTSSSSAAAAAPLRPSKWVRPSYILSQTWRDRDPDLHVVSITASKELAWFFASSQRRPSRASWLVPRAECFVLIRSGRGCVGVVPLLAADLKAEAEQESLPTSSKSKSTVDPALASSGRVLWLHDRHGLQRGPKTTSIVAVSGPQPDACVAVASDNRRRIALYDRSGLTDAKPNATADSPLGSAKAFRWHDVAVSPAGDAVAAVCSCEGQEQALWLWARSAGDDQRGEGRWQRVGGASSPAMRVGAGGGLVAVEARVEEGGTAALVRTEVGPSQRPAVQEAKLEGFGGAARALAALSDGGDRAAVGIAGVAVPEAGVAVYVLDRRLEVVTEITSVGGDSNPGPIVALCFVPGGQGRVATLCEGGRALVHDAETGELAARCDDLGATFGFATLHPAVWGETVGLACGGGDGSVAVLSARGERAREGDGESESEGGLGATEEEEEEEMVVVGGEAGDPTWSGLVGSLMAEGDGEGDLPYLAEDLRGLLAKLPPGRGALSSLRRVAGSLCREGLHLRAAWVLEVAEASGELGGALANVDWLGLWERVANSAFERAEAEGAEPSRYQPLADALWKRLRASGLAPLVKPQIEAARSRSGRGHGTEASAALVEADRSFVLGDLDGSLALYASCGPAASLSTIACCVHARRLDEALQAAHDLLLAAEEDKSLVAEVREACSELGTLLLDLQPDKGVGCSDPADRSDLKIKIFFPSPVSWRAGDQNRRLALDRHELLRGHDHNGRMGGEPSVALALGLQCHALEPSALARGLEDAADVWDRAGHWKRACSLLESGARVMRQQGRPGDAASCEDGMASLVERRAAAMVGEGATTNPQLAPDLIQALAALRRRPEAYSRALRVALGAARAQIAGWCEIGDLGRLKALERGSKMAQEALGATLAALVAAAEPGLEVAGATLEEDWSVRVEVRGGGPSQEAARTALEEWVALASAARPYALLSLQWKQWQSSADASERRDCMREYALLLGLSLASDPEGLLRRPRDAQREACWVLRDLVSPEVVAEDPALVSLLAMCAGEDRLTGPTRRALLEMMASTGAEGDQEDYEEEAGYYLDVLRSDAETHVEELADICRSALRAADGGGGHKAGQVDEAIRSIWSMAEEILRGVPGRSSSGGWPDLSECVSHPLNCGEGVAIQTDEAVLASILNLGDLHVEDSGSAEEVPEELSAEELAMEEESAGEEEEGTRYVCAAFDYGSSAGLECEPGPGPVVLRIVVGAGEEEALEPTAEDPIPEAADLPGSEGGAEVLDKAAEKLVEEALAWAVEEAESRALAAAEDAAKDLVEKAIANAISEAVKLTERAATVESVEAVEEETPLEVEPEPDQEVSLTPAAAPGTEQAEPLECADEEPRLEESPCEALIEDAARTLVENAIAAAVSATVLEHAAVAEQEPDQPKAESLEEAAVKPDPLSPEEVSGDALVVRSLVEDAISHAISATILQDVAEASIGMAGPAAPQAAPSPAGSEKTPAEPSDSPPSACEATPERESEPDASSSTKPLGDDTSDAGPESSQAVDSSLDGGDEVHSISDGSRRGGTFEDPGEIEAEEKAEERPWDTDLALFQSLGAGGGPPAPAPQPSKAQRPSRKEQRRRRQRQKTKPAAPASSDRRTSAESRAATTQTDPPATLGADIVVVEVARADPAVTEDLAPPTADLPAEGSPEGKSSHKDRVLSELRRIKEEYLAAIQDAQAALSGEDPSIGKVLGSQVETLQDYGEVLELAAASGEAEYGEVMVTASEGRQEEGEAPGDPEPEPAAEPASEPKVAEAEAEGDGARRRRRAAEMLKRIVRTSRDRRRSKGQERGPAFADAASSPIPPPSPPPPPAADLRSEVPLMRQADNLLEQMEEAVDLSSRTTLHQSDSEEPREENAALAAEEGDPPDLAKAALAALAAARFGLSGGSDPAFDLFSHFFELKSADPTSRLREKFRASPHTSAGLVRSSGLRGLLDQLSQFCGAGYSEQGVWYTELLFTLVLGGGRGSGWAAPEDSFVQVSWHYYQAHRPTGREERESEAVGALRSAVLALGGEVDLVAALEASEGSGIHTLPALPRLLGTLLRLAGHEPQVRDLCLLFGHLMRSPLGARADFEARDLMEVVRTGKVERWEEKRKEEAGQREPVAVVVSQMETSDSDSEDAVEAVEETVQQQQIKPPEAAQMMETSDSDSEDAVEVVEAVEETVQPAEEATPAPVRAPSTPAPAPAPAPKRDAATSPVSLPQPSPPPEPASPEASAEIDEEESEDIGGLGWLREGEAALKEILLDAKGGAEESWRRAPASPLERGSPRAVVDFFDVRTITAEDFHRESPDRSSVGLGLGGASTPRSRDSAPHPVPLPASNAELLAIFAEMEEEEPPPPRKKPASRVGGKVARKLERETTRALSRLKKAQASRRDRARDEVRDHSRREEQAMRRAREEVSKYARARQRNYNSMLRDVEEALVDAQVAAHTLEEENAQLRVCLDELSGEHRQEHDAYLGRLRDHLALVEAQVGAPLE